MSIAAPTDIVSPALALWHKSDTSVFSDAGTTPAVDGDTIQQWNDLSGNARHSTQATAGSRPKFASSPSAGPACIRMRKSDSGQRYFNLNAGVPSNTKSMTIFGVLEIPWTRNTNGAPQAIIAPGASGTIGLVSVDFASDRSVLSMFDSGGAHFINTTADVPVSRFAFCVVFSATGIKTYVNDIEYPEDTSTFNASTGVGGKIFQYSTLWNLYGDVFEFGMYAGDLSSSQVTDLMGYLMLRHGIPSTSAQVVFVGDSITAGLTTQDTDNILYPNTTVAPLGVLMYNCASPGRGFFDSTPTLLDEIATRVGPIIKSTVDIRGLVLFAGTNDLGSHEASQIYDAIVEYATVARQTYGFNKVAVLTALPRSAGGDETRRLALNTLIRNGYSTWADTVIDVGADPRLAEMSTKYYHSDSGQYVHPNANGKRVLSELVRTGLAKWFGSGDLYTTLSHNPQIRNVYLP